MRLITGHDETVASFVAALIGKRMENGFGPNTSYGVIDAAGNLVGGFVWHNWDRHSATIEMSGASRSPKWLTRSILRAVFDSVFASGIQMIVTRNSARNMRLHRLLKWIGFHGVTVPRLMGRDEDGMVWYLTDDDWRASPVVTGAI